MPNVYDFDKTIVYPDSGREFLRFCYRRHFGGMLPFLPALVAESLRFAAARRRGLPAKGEFYGFLTRLPDWREEVRLFWEAHAERMLKPWYLAQKRPDDVVVSCSPDFLLAPLCLRLGVRLVCTEVDTATGRLRGPSCYGSEKVRRLRAAHGNLEIGEFYSDSLADAPLAALAGRAFLVKGDERMPWPGR